MVILGLLLEYQWPEWVEREWTVFPLWPGYGTTGEEVHSVILGVLLLGTDQHPARILDHAGEVWEVIPDTVRAVVVWEGSKEHGSVLTPWMWLCSPLPQRG